MEDFKRQKPAEPACCTSRWAGAGSSAALPANAKALLWHFFQGSHLKVNSFQGGFIQVSPIDTKKLSTVTGIGKEGRCCRRSVNLPEEGEREKGTWQCNIVPGEIQALSVGVHPGWAANTVTIKPYNFLTTHAEPSSSQH